MVSFTLYRIPHDPRRSLPWSLIPAHGVRLLHPFPSLIPPLPSPSISRPQGAVSDGMEGGGVVGREGEVSDMGANTAQESRVNRLSMKSLPFSTRS